MAVRAELGVPYGLGKVLDVYRPGDDTVVPVVLLWHGVGPDERDVLGTLAGAVAERGAMVLVPDWRRDSADGGRAQLLTSLAFAREHCAGMGGDPDRFVLAGWSMGGMAAAGVALHPELAGGWRPSAVACFGSSFVRIAPTTGTAPADDLAGTSLPPVPFWLVHGTDDPVVPVARSVAFAAGLAARRWPVRFEQPDTDHAGVVMTVYDPELGRCRPAHDGRALTAGRRTAKLLSMAAGLA
jgi:acetyl esterase/lipase